ncbi:MAG: hypothetical protein GY906_21400 [bacterium]|nr:hypothetical protein [bacterium]
MTQPTSPPTLRRISFFYLPLSVQWLMMATEGPFLAAIIARLAEPKFNLAAYGVAFSIALIVEAPIIMMMSASTALVRDWASHRRLLAFTHMLNAGITVLMGIALLPPVFYFFTIGLLDLPPHIAHLTHVSTFLLLPWPAAIGYRRYYHGILIRHGQTRRVAFGTFIRLGIMVVVALALAKVEGFAGAWVGAAALSIGVVVEAVIARVMVHTRLRQLRESAATTPDTTPPPSYTEIFRFYYPLALTSMLTLGLHPIVTFFVGHGRAPVESLAVLPVINSLVFVFRSFGLAYQEVGIALMDDDLLAYRNLRRFAALLSTGAALGLLLIAWTPLSHIWFHQISGLSLELTEFALLPIQILSTMPALSVILSFQRSLLVHFRDTGPVTWATVVEVVGVVGVMFVAIVWLDVLGAVAAAIAFMVGRIGSNLYLIPPIRRNLSRHTA